MNAIIVDDEPLSLDYMQNTLQELCEFHNVWAFASPAAALEWIAENPADIAFLDISMGELSGLSLAKQMKENTPDCFIIFVTGYPQYAVDAFALHASGYLLKPVSREQIRKEVEFIRTLPAPASHARSRIRVQCFGNFEVFINGEPANFRYAKTKELFAYLIDRKGAFCLNGEIMAVLWEDRANTLGQASHFRNLLADLNKVLKPAASPPVLIKRRGMLAVAPDGIDCDYYRYLKGDISGVNAYYGEYMTQYSWGEFTLGELGGGK